MDIILVYIVLFCLTFMACGIYLMVSEGYLKNILVISLLNVLFFLAKFTYRATDKLAKRKIRRDFKLEKDKDDGAYYYPMKYWKAYGGNIEDNSTWNTFLNNLKVLFGKMKGVAE